MNYRNVTAVLALLSPLGLAQERAPIIDLPNDQQVRSAAQTQQAAAQSDSYYQMQVMQDEIRQLRGMVEELSYEVQRLKQRQMDDYVDIDRRLAELVRNGASTGTPAVTGQPGDGQAQASGESSAQPATVEATPEMTADYTAASNLLLKQRDIDGAALAFKKHVVDFPDSPYVANAWYWLGEIYLLKGQDEEARQAFTVVVDQFTSHAKAQDATFKLGKIYHQLGDMQQSRTLLERAAAGEGSAALKAKTFLSDNF